MENNARCLIAACHRIGLDHEVIDLEGNFIRIRIGVQWEYFQLNRSPFNSETVASICLDKSHSYQLLSNTIKMPKTIQFLDPSIEDRYKCYLSKDSVESIIEEIESTLSYPIVVKSNRGALGKSVFLCAEYSEVRRAILNIFNPQSKNYDYILLAQEYLPKDTEYRLVCGFQKPLLLYSGSGSQFNARFWENSEGIAQFEDCKILIDELINFVQPVFEQINLGLVGFDIIRSQQGELYLIELNSGPRFDHFISKNGSEAVVNLYCSLLSDALIRSQQAGD